MADEVRRRCSLCCWAEGTWRANSAPTCRDQACSTHHCWTPLRAAGSGQCGCDYGREGEAVDIHSRSCARQCRDEVPGANTSRKAVVRILGDIRQGHRRGGGVIGKMQGTRAPSMTARGCSGAMTWMQLSKKLALELQRSRTRSTNHSATTIGRWSARPWVGPSAKHRL